MQRNTNGSRRRETTTRRIPVRRALRVGVAVFGALLSCGAAFGLQPAPTETFVPLAQGKPYLHVMHEGRSVRIQRVQDPDYELQGYFAKTIRSCPPFCVQPMSPDPRVRTIGEIEFFEFLEHNLRDGRGVVIDARTEAWFDKGTIPGSVNYPFSMFNDDNRPAVEALFEEFGAKRRDELGYFSRLLEEWGLVDTHLKTVEWDFTKAKDLVVWCNGPACGQSPRAIKGLLAAGYPGEKISYYRGGMQLWQLWGLTTVAPQ